MGNENFIINSCVVFNSYVGFVEAINQVNIVPYISGYLDTIFVKPGKQVKEDDVLGIILPYEKLDDNLDLEFIGILPKDINTYINGLTKDKLINNGINIPLYNDALKRFLKSEGELNAIGLRAHYLLGIATKKRYENFYSSK